MNRTLYLLLLPLFAFTSDTWQPFAVDSQVTVQLPVKPTQISSKAFAAYPRPTSGWMARTTEDIYIIIRARAQKRIGRSDTSKRLAFYDSVAAVGVRAYKERLSAKSYFPTAMGIGCELTYTGVNRTAHLRETVYLRSLVVDSIGYSFHYLATDYQDSLGLAGAEQRRRFFNSVTVKP